MVLVGQGSIARWLTGRIDNILYADRNTGEGQCSVKRARFDLLRQVRECPNLRVENSSPIAQFSQVGRRGTGSGLETLKNFKHPELEYIRCTHYSSFRS